MAKTTTPEITLPEDIDTIISNTINAAAGKSLKGFKLSHVAADRFALIPEKTMVEAKIAKIERKLSAAGKEMLVADLSVVSPREYAGIEIRDYIQLETDNPWKLKSLCAAVPGALDAEGNIAFDSEQQFRDHVLRFPIVHSEYQERVKNAVRGGYTPASEAPGLTVTGPGSWN